MDNNVVKRKITQWLSLNLFYLRIISFLTLTAGNKFMKTSKNYFSYNHIIGQIKMMIKLDEKKTVRTNGKTRNIMKNIFLDT